MVEDTTTPSVDTITPIPVTTTVTKTTTTVTTQEVKYAFTQYGITESGTSPEDAEAKAQENNLIS